MKTLILMTLVSLFAVSSQANPRLARRIEVLMSPAGPTVVAEIDAIEFGDLKLEGCTDLQPYNGPVRLLRFGTQTYKLTGIETAREKICATDTDFSKFDQVILHFVNQDTIYANPIRVVLPKATAPAAYIVSGSDLFKGKILE